jgi:2-keto-3-deoxy-L-rhamnonate aldolase RhmA
MNLLKQRFHDLQPVIAVNVGGRNPDVMAALANAGAHAAFIDCERSGIGLDVATELIRAAKVTGLTSLVRSWSKDPAVLVQFMDRQVDGLVVPHINCAQDAIDVVELVRYACGNDKAPQKIIIVQIETRQAIESLDEIMAVPGIDAYLIGPNDLAYSLMGQRSAKTPEVLAAVARFPSVSTLPVSLLACQPSSTSCQTFWLQALRSCTTPLSGYSAAH